MMYLIEENYDFTDDEEEMATNQMNVVDDNDIKIEIQENLLTSFIDSISLNSIKKRLTYQIPCHNKLIEKSIIENDKQSKINFDVAKIRTSEDLINILEDDYERHSSDHKKHQTGEIFKIPKINIHPEENVESFDFDEYLKSIVNVKYDDFKSFRSNVFCMLCTSNNERKLENVQELQMHTFAAHHIDTDSFWCILNENCGSFDNINSLNNHLFTEHQTIIE